MILSPPNFKSFLPFLLFQFLSLQTFSAWLSSPLPFSYTIYFLSYNLRVYPTAVINYRSSMSLVFKKKIKYCTSLLCLRSSPLSLITEHDFLLILFISSFTMLQNITSFSLFFLELFSSFLTCFFLLRYSSKPSSLSVISSILTHIKSTT